MNNEGDNTADILVVATREKLNFLLNSDNTIDSKAGVLFASILVVIVFILTSGAYSVCTDVLVTVLLVIASIKLYKVLDIKTYTTGVVNFYDKNHINYRKMNRNDLLEQLLSDYQKAFDDNAKILEEKNINYKTAMILFSVSVMLIIISYLI